VNADTKSAAEMLAGALRDDRHALLVGARTFGKGVVQRVWDFDNGTSVKITSARFYLPGGSMIHGVGITPDRIVARAVPSTTETDEQIRAGARVLQTQLASTP